MTEERCEIRIKPQLSDINNSLNFDSNILLIHLEATETSEGLIFFAPFFVSFI